MSERMAEIQVLWETRGGLGRRTFGLTTWGDRKKYDDLTERIARLATRHCEQLEKDNAILRSLPRMAKLLQDEEILKKLREVGNVALHYAHAQVEAKELRAKLDRIKEGARKLSDAAFDCYSYFWENVKLEDKKADAYMEKLGKVQCGLTELLEEGAEQ